MKIALYILLFFLFDSYQSFTKTFDNNNLIEEAESSFINQNYDQSITVLQTLLDSISNHHEILQLNLAHAHYLKGDTSSYKDAKSNYQLITSNENKEFASISYNQIGNIDFNTFISKHPKILDQPLDQTAKDNIKELMEYYKDALRSNSANEKARYNYELMYWLLHKDDNQQQQNQDNQDQQNNKDQKDQQKENQENKENQNDQNKGEKDKKSQEGQQDKKEKENNKDQEEGKKDQKGKQEEQKNSKQSQEEKKGKEQNQEQGKKGEEKQESQEGQPQKGIKLSKEQAMQLLRSGQNKEKKYLEREIKKSSKPIDTDKPDW